MPVKPWHSALFNFTFKSVADYKVKSLIQVFQKLGNLLKIIRAIRIRHKNMISVSGLKSFKICYAITFSIVLYDFNIIFFGNID